MKNSLLCVSAALVLAVVFSTVSVTAQKTKPIDIKSTVAKTGSKTPAPKPMVQSSNQSAVAPVSFEQSVLDEINAVRTNPQKYIQYLEDYKKLFKGNTAFLPKSIMLETREGTAVIDEAINDLKNLKPLNPYSFSDGLNKVVSLHMKDLVENPSLAHKGKDGSDLMTRLSRGGRIGGNYAENITYRDETARDVVLTMIIDDGVKSRGHRKNILSPTFKVIGIAFSKGKSGESLCVINFIESYADAGAKPTGIQEF